MIPNSFSVRTYAVCENEGKILGLYEYHNNELYCKLPGGGVEFGEGLLDCLHREFQEELNVEIEIIEHLYTQEDFIQSIFDSTKQILIIYYIVKIKNLQDIKANCAEIQRFEWIDINNHCFSLPTDIIAVEKFKDRKKTL